MSSVNLSIDIDRIQSSVQAAIRPAVDAALKDVDMVAIIKARLNAPPVTERLSISRFFYADERQQESLIDSLVHAGIKDMAKGYVERELAAQKPMLEEAFCQMMKGSQSRIVQAFAEAMTGAIKDMDFQLSTTVAHKDRNDD